MDCFLLEGPKILFRISLALVHLYTKGMWGGKRIDLFVWTILSYLGIKHESNGKNQNMVDFCQQIPVSIDRLLRVSD